jgi:Uma2 family endonuclease
MAVPARRPATYEDVLAAPEHMIAQVIDGDLHLHPRPAKPHAAATSALAADLHSPFGRGRGGPGGWILLFEPELHVGRDILVPDLAGWRRERMPVLTKDLPYFTLAPDWVCEALSPSTAALDRSAKLRVYAREKVPHVWFVDPLARSLEVLLLDGATYRILEVYREDEKVRAVPFDAIELELGVLWADVER